jgi:HK97 family phage major capsid protein
VATDDATRPWAKFQHVPTGVSGAFNVAGGNGAEVFLDVISKLRPVYRANAKWLMNRATYAAVAKLQDGNKRFLLEQNVAAGTPPSLLGFPVVTAEDVPAIGAGSYSIAFGDLSRTYTVVDRVGVRVLRDQFTNKPFVRFYSTMRVGGNVHDFNGLKFIKFAAS